MNIPEMKSLIENKPFSITENKISLNTETFVSVEKDETNDSDEIKTIKLLNNLTELLNIAYKKGVVDTIEKSFKK